jgi:hypothetical protein
MPFGRLPHSRRGRPDSQAACASSISSARCPPANSVRHLLGGRCSPRQRLLLRSPADGAASSIAVNDDVHHFLGRHRCEQTVRSSSANSVAHQSFTRPASSMRDAFVEVGVFLPPCPASAFQVGEYGCRRASTSAQQRRERFRPQARVRVAVTQELRDGLACGSSTAIGAECHLLRPSTQVETDCLLTAPSSRASSCGRQS